MIGYYVHHQGSGHARRALAVARHLREEVTGLGSGPAPHGWPGAWVSLARDDDPAPDPTPEVSDVTAHGVLHWAPRHHHGLLRRHRQLVEWLDAAAPRLVVVDVSVEVSLLVRLCGVPVVVGGMPGRRTDPVHALAHDVADAILAPWPPGAHDLSGWPQRWKDKLWEVGAVSALARSEDSREQAPQRAGAADLVSGEDSSRSGQRGGEVLVLWGGGGDPVPEEALSAARNATPGWRWTVRCGGHPVSTGPAPRPDGG